MNLEVIFIEAIILAMYFTITIFDLTRKHKYSPSMIANYPKEIQEEYFKTHERVDVSHKSPLVFFITFWALLVLTALLFACAYIAGAKTFYDGFVVSFGLMLWIGVFDTVFINFILFAKIDFFRLEGTKHMDKEYHQKWFYIKRMLFPGILYALISSSAVGGLIMLVRQVLSFK